MKKKILLISIFLGLSGCYPQSDSSNNVNTRTIGSNNCSSNNNISEETAILIGKGMTLFDYDLRECNVRVEDEGSVWKVAFTRKIKEHNQTGECPTVWVSKKNGEITKAALPK